MIAIVKTPLRVSLFGGGTDYPAYFERLPGAVLGFTIDKYIYITALPLTAGVDYRYRLSYSKVEHAEHVDEIEHPVVRTVLQHYRWDRPTDFSIQADLPAGVGLGSSSAFTVSVINLVSHLMGTPRTRIELARQAIYTEQVLLRENVGVQDQLHASFGGINRFDFHGKDFRITPINVSGRNLRTLSEWLVLVYTRVTRRATDIVADQIEKIKSGDIDHGLTEMLRTVDAAQDILENDDRFDQVPIELASLLREAWRRKKQLWPNVSGQVLDDFYEFCLSKGAIGGKLCGAGGGGFLLMVVPPEQRASFEAAVGPRQCVRFQVDLHGTTLLPSLPMSTVDALQI